MTRLADLGRLIAEHQDRARPAAPRDDAAAQLFVQKLRHERRAPRYLWASAAAVLLVAASGLSYVGWERHKMSVAGARAPQVGQALVARDGQVVPLNFPDGSRVVLSSGTEAIVHELRDSGASLEVTRGEASVAVRHRPETNWLVNAGPYRVRVTGTRFTVGWAPDPKRFELHLAQGSVVVSGESSTHSAVTMVAPQSLVIDARGWQLSGAETVSATPSASVGPSPEVLDPDVTAAPVASERTPSSVPSTTAAVKWEELALHGKYAAAYDEAARRGIAQLTESRPSSTLLSLAETCRFSGHTGEAAQVLTRLRSRFPGTDDAATAAFQLGRLGGSAAWFRTYLQERPHGALAREASGRLLEALESSGDRAAAQRAAEAYLQRYPSGPHAAFAKQLLGR